MKECSSERWRFHVRVLRRPQAGSTVAATAGARFALPNLMPTMKEDDRIPPHRRRRRG